MVPGPSVPARAEPLAQAKELAVLALIYLLQITNAEMLRRATGVLTRQHSGPEATSLVKSY